MKRHASALLGLALLAFGCTQCVLPATGIFLVVHSNRQMRPVRVTLVSSSGTYMSSEVFVSTRPSSDPTLRDVVGSLPLPAPVPFEARSFTIVADLLNMGSDMPEVSQRMNVTFRDQVLQRLDMHLLAQCALPNAPCSGMGNNGAMQCGLGPLGAQCVGTTAQNLPAYVVGETPSGVTIPDNLFVQPPGDGGAH